MPTTVTYTTESEDISVDDRSTDAAAAYLRYGRRMEARQALDWWNAWRPSQQRSIFDAYKSNPAGVCDILPNMATLNKYYVMMYSGLTSAHVELASRCGNCDRPKKTHTRNKCIYGPRSFEWVADQPTK